MAQVLTQWGADSSGTPVFFSDGFQLTDLMRPACIVEGPLLSPESADLNVNPICETPRRH